MEENTENLERNIRRYQVWYTEQRCVSNSVEAVMTEHLEHKSENLISGFRKCGIFPIDKQQLLERLPRNYVNVDVIGNAFIQHMVQRSEECGAKAK
jgi:hypothetical protein